MKVDTWQNTINQTNLEIARTNFGVSTLEASKKLFGQKYLKDRVADWENGQEYPSYNQLEKLADIYNLTIYHFLTEDELVRTELPKAFRTSSQTTTGQYELHRFINILRSRQAIIRDSLKRDGLPKNSLVGLGKNYSDPDELAELIRKEFSYQPVDRPDGQSILAYLRSNLHKQGIFVFKTMSTKRDTIEPEVMKGLYLNDEHAPCIAINRRDYLKSQLFSLAHELAHLFRGEEKIDSIAFRKLGQLNDQEETFCNKVAASLLLPKESINPPDNIQTGYNLEAVKHLAEAHQVSDLVSLYRLTSLGYIRDSDLSKFRRQLNLDYNAFKAAELARKQRRKDKGRSGGNYYNNMRDSNGQLFDEFVFSLHIDGRLSAVEAQNLLRMPLTEVSTR